MRQSSNGVFTTILMLVPVVVIPLIAMFGLPSLPENRSPEGTGAGFMATNTPEAILGTQSDFQQAGMQSPGLNQSPETPSGFSQQSEADPNLLAGHSQSPTGFNNQSTTSQDQFGQSATTETPQPVTPTQTPVQPGNTGFPSSNNLSSNNLLSDQSLPGQNQFPSGQPAAINPQAAGTATANPFPVENSNNPFEKTITAGAEQPAAAQNQIQQLGGNSNSATPFGNATESSEPNRFNQNFGNNGNQATLPTANSTPRLTWAEAVQQLNSYGITNFLLQPGSQPGTFHFSCFYIPDKKLRITHRFESEAVDPLKAFENVLQQIQQRRQSVPSQ